MLFCIKYRARRFQSRAPETSQWLATCIEEVVQILESRSKPDWLTDCHINIAKLPQRVKVKQTDSDMTDSNIEKEVLL